MTVSLAPDTTMQDRGAKETPRRLRIVLWIIIGTLLVLLSGQLVFHFLLAPTLTIRSIKVQSEVDLSRDEVIRLAGLGDGARYFSVDEDAIRVRLESHPPVRTAEVKKAFPREISVRITARKPLGMALVPVGERSVPVVFDEEGVIYEVGADVRDWDLPVLSGLRFAEYRPGTRLPEVLRGLLADLRGLRETEPALYRIISEIRINPVSTGDYELKVFFLGYRRAVRLGGELSAATLKNAVVVLDVMEREGVPAKVREVDFRMREVVYDEVE